MKHIRALYNIDSHQSVVLICAQESERFAYLVSLDPMLECGQERPKSATMSRNSRNYVLRRVWSEIMEAGNMQGECAGPDTPPPSAASAAASIHVAAVRQPRTYRR